MQQHTQPRDDLLIRVSAQRHNGRVVSATVAIPENVTPSALVIGLDQTAALATLGRLATHSPHSHTQALAQACAAALGLPAADHDIQLAIERELAAEAVDTHLQRLLIDWPLCLGMDARQNRYAEFHRRLNSRTDPTACFALGGDVLDLVAREMLAGFFNRIRMPHNLTEFIDCADTGGVLGAVLAEMINLGPSQPQQKHAAPLLGTLSAAAWSAAVGNWPSAEFIARPSFGGEPAETGPLARHAASSLVRLLLDRGHRLSARLLSKAIDLADCASRMRYPLTDDVPPMVDAVQVVPGVGLSRVSTARGVLLCWVRMEGELIAECAIIPASAWNFHPQSAFCREACGEQEETHAAALQRLSLLALALDPSLPFVIDLSDLSVLNNSSKEKPKGRKRRSAPAAQVKATDADKPRKSKAAARAPRCRS